MRIRRLFAGVAVGAVCVQVSAHSSVAAYVEISIAVETETAGRPGQAIRQEQEPSEVLGQAFRQEQEPSEVLGQAFRQVQEPSEVLGQAFRQEQEPSEVLGQAIRQVQEPDKSQEASLRQEQELELGQEQEQEQKQEQEPDEAHEQEWKQELEQEQERADTLKAAVFTGRSVRHYSDHQKFYLGKEDREGSATALETLKLIPGILVRDDEVSMMNGKGLTILLNGLPTTSASLSLLTPADIKSIDFYQNAPARYSFAGSGSMVNIITRRPGIGGNLMLNLKGAVTTPWGNNAVSYRQVLKNTMIGIEYSGKPTKSGGYGINEFLEYEAGGNRYTKVKKGLDTDFTRNRHNITLDLVRMKDENSALKAQFTLGYEKKDWPVSQSALKTVTNLTTQESTTSEVTDHKDDWSEYLSPALDIYWNRRFSDRHELSVNFVATAYDTKSRKGFYEYAGATPLLSSTSLTDGRKYSGIIEAVYGWTLSEKHKLGFGARTTASLAEQNSGNGEVTVRSDINTDLGRLWCEYSGNAGGFSYSVGAAMEHFGYETKASGRHDYIYFRPLVQLNYTFNDHSSMYFNYSSNTSTPKIGWMGDASYYKDDKWLVRSNPELESYTTRDAMIGYSFNNSWLYINPYILVYHNDNQIIPIFSHTDGLLVERDENSGNMIAVMAALGGRIKPFRNIPLSLTVYAMYNDQRLTGGGADRSVKSLGGMAMLRYSGKKWTAEAMYNQPFKSISDIGISKGENYGYFEFARRIGKNLRIGAGMRYPFYHWKVSEETAPGSPVTMKNTSRMTSQKNTVILTCVYNFSYGKKVRTVNQKIRNADIDSGL